MDRAIIDRLPSAFVDGFTKYLKDAEAKEDLVYTRNSELFLNTKDEAARGRALEARGRRLAYSEILNKIMGDKNAR